MPDLSTKMRKIVDISGIGFIYMGRGRKGGVRMTLEECYAQMGGDLAGALAVMQSRERLARYLLRFAADPTAQMLFASLRAGRTDDALRAAHTLTGLCRGLGLTQLCRACRALADGLRGGQAPQDDALTERAKEAYACTLRAIGELRGGA